MGAGMEAKHYRVDVRHRSRGAKKIGKQNGMVYFPEFSGAAVNVASHNQFNACSLASPHQNIVACLHPFWGDSTFSLIRV